jgi:hypothetical protein
LRCVMGLSKPGISESGTGGGDHLEGSLFRYVYITKLLYFDGLLVYSMHLLVDDDYIVSGH